MLRLSKLADYATLIMSYLAESPARVASAMEIAKALKLSTPTVSKILKILLTAKLLHSYRGNAGGYQLSKDANDITLAEIISALEGNLAMTECCSKIENLCGLQTLCTLKDNWKAINNIILNTLSTITLKNMLQPLAQQTLKGIPIVRGS